VDRWVSENPRHKAVRGWVTVGSDGATRIFLTHHSVVQEESGHLFDITPLLNEQGRTKMLFVPHVGSDAEFFVLKDQAQPFLECQATQFE
jgi:hypothetical protein